MVDPLDSYVKQYAFYTSEAFMRIFKPDRELWNGEVPIFIDGLKLGRGTIAEVFSKNLHLELYFRRLIIYIMISLYVDV